MDLGFVNNAENVRIEKYLTEGEKLAALTFYKNAVEIDLFANSGAKMNSGFCFFELGKDALSIFDINTSLLLLPHKNIGTFTLRRLEELAGERGIKTIYAVDSKNDGYWLDRLGFERYSDPLPRKFEGNLDFVKLVDKPPISVKQKFVPLGVEYAQKGRFSLDLQKFEPDAANLIGISLEDYRSLDPSEITVMLIDARKQQKRR